MDQRVRWLLTSANIIGALSAAFLLVSMLTRHEGVWRELAGAATVMLALFLGSVWAAFKPGWPLRLLEVVSAIIAISWTVLFVAMWQVKS